MLAPVRTVAPAAPLLTTAQAKAHLRVDHSDDDTYIDDLVAEATAHMDGWSGVLGRALLPQTWRQDFNAFGCLRLPLVPVASIAALTYYDSANVQQTLATSVYQVFADARGAYVDLKPDEDWPASYSRPDAVSVTFVAGYADANAVPASIKRAAKLRIGHWYTNREAVVVGTITSSVPVAVDALLEPYRRIGV